ncbi:fatty acid synthase-like [Dermacentor silvarum]|uniref:fatty acid synthase-like n=1 Tax=Dermacentor silvarum TaxID=543639 RepID=UPI0021019319|nr:fatty acid synthase-like [Dermacentor silvarum]
MNDVEAEGTRVFLLHPIEGHVDALRELAAQLPVHAVGVQWTPGVPARTVEEMAAAYLQEIFELQPEGPYHVSGYSFGAMVAFEMALQLQASGASVGSVTLLDGAPKSIAADLDHRRSQFSDSEEEHETALFCGFLADYFDLDITELRGQLDKCLGWDAKLEAAIDIILKALPDGLPRSRKTLSCPYTSSAISCERLRSTYQAQYSTETWCWSGHPGRRGCCVSCPTTTVCRSVATAKSGST